MAKPRRRPNMTEKLAACLCELNRNGVYLIPEQLRMHGTAKEICAYVEWDHVTPWTWTADNRPQNLTPMAPAAHRAKTKQQRPAINKVRRGLKKREQKAVERAVALLAPIVAEKPPRARKPKRPMPGSKASPWRKRMDGTVERRAP